MNWFDIISKPFEYTIGTLVGTILNFVIQGLVVLLNGILTSQDFKTILTNATSGDLTGLCSGKVDCDGQTLAMAIAPYAGFLGLCCWGYAVLKSIDDMTQAELLQLMFLVRRGVVMMFGVWFVYPAARMLWEICRVTSNAMVYDLNCGAQGAAGAGGCNQLAITLPNLSTGQFGGGWVLLAYTVLTLIEVAFLVVWMLGSSVGVLIGSIFGSFAVAVSPLSGTQGMLGKYIKTMMGFYLLRLVLPPAAAILTKVMTNYSGTTAGGGAGATLSLFQGLSAVALMFALLWMTGKVIGFVGDGVVAGAGTVSGLFDTGKRHGQSALNMAMGPAGMVRAARQGYRGIVRQGRADVMTRKNAATARMDLAEHPTELEARIEPLGKALSWGSKHVPGPVGRGMARTGQFMQNVGSQLGSQLPREGREYVGPQGHPGGGVRGPTHGPPGPVGTQGPVSSGPGPVPGGGPTPTYPGDDYNIPRADGGNIFPDFVPKRHPLVDRAYRGVVDPSKTPQQQRRAASVARAVITGMRILRKYTP